MRETVSYHMFRRTARKRAHIIHHDHPQNVYRVESTLRGPWGWKVVRIK